MSPYSSMYCPNHSSTTFRMYRPPIIPHISYMMRDAEYPLSRHFPSISLRLLFLLQHLDSLQGYSRANARCTMPNASLSTPTSPCVLLQHRTHPTHFSGSRQSDAGINRNMARTGINVYSIGAWLLLCLIGKFSNEIRARDEECHLVSRPLILN